MFYWYCPNRVKIVIVQYEYRAHVLLGIPGRHETIVETGRDAEFLVVATNEAPTLQANGRRLLQSSHVAALGERSVSFLAVSLQREKHDLRGRQAGYVSQTLWKRSCYLTLRLDTP